MSTKNCSRGGRGRGKAASLRAGSLHMVTKLPQRQQRLRWLPSAKAQHGPAQSSILRPARGVTTGTGQASQPKQS